MSIDDLLGAWSYRAFRDEPDLRKPFNDLRFATAKLVLEGNEGGRLTGLLKSEGWGSLDEWGLTLEGSFDGAEFMLRGHNVIEGEDWIYDYRGRLLPHWPNAVNARDVLTGSVIRTEARIKDKMQAGEHATFIAVKR
ncbi:MAG TPA: hypothetical protein VKA18_01360 [Alphaproteobacteria bacterium]|nr:hypothetical protein [Alphaproteobacteria bacterium]